MRLTIKNISAFLMEKGLLKAQSVVDGDYMVTQTQNRNAIFKIHLRNAKSLFVKQLVSFDQQNTYFLQKDATCLWLIKNEEAYRELAQYVPEYYGYDPEKQVLIVEYLPEAKNLEEVYQLNKQLSPEVLEQVAKILASYHFPLEDRTSTNRAVQFFMRQLPWTFQFAAAPLESNPQMYGNNPVVQYLGQQTEFRQLMKETIEDYQFTSLIHGDIKNVNFILGDQNKAETLKLIDWEISDIGDPLWDAAGLVQSLLTSRVLMHTPTTPYQGTTTISQEEMQKTLEEIRIFWEAYAKLRKFSEADSKASLSKTLRFAGMRLIQTAFEHNNTQAQLQPNVIKILQISHSLLQTPDQLIQAIYSPQSNPVSYEYAS